MISSRQAFGRLVQVFIFLGMMVWSLASWGLPTNMTPGYVYTVVGDFSAGYSGDDGPAILATISGAQGIAVDANGNLYIADHGNRRVRKVTPGGIISSVPGLDINYPVDVAVDNAGNLYVADYGNNRVRKVEAADGTVITIAGTGARGVSSDGGPATSSMLTPTAVAVDQSGNLYIADSENFRIRKVTGGIIATVAGTGASGYSGDGGPASAARIGTVTSMTFDSAGNLYFSDRDFNRVRKIANGIITTVAGNGGTQSNDDSRPQVATDIAFATPYGIAIDKFDNLYVATGNDYPFNHRFIRKVSNGITTAFTASAGGVTSEGQPAYATQTYQPRGLAIDGTGSLYFAQYVTGEVPYSQVRMVATTAPVSIFGLSIACPKTVDAGTSAACSSSVINSDGSSQPVSPNWGSSDLSAAVMNGNIVTANNVTSDTGVTISASYTENGVAKIARQMVTISSHGYTVTDLVPLNGVYSLATAINNRGEVAGYTGQHAFVYSNGNLINLGLLFGDRNGVPTQANGINDFGQVVGFMNGPNGYSFLYGDGKLTGLGPANGTGSHAFGINNSGQIVGHISVPNIDNSGATNHAFLYENGSYKDLGTLEQSSAYSGYGSIAYGVNDSGQVVGVSTRPGAYQRAFLYSNGSMTDIGLLGLGNCGADAINNNTQITGTCFHGDGRNHAYLYSNGSMSDLGALNEVVSIPWGMNNKGEVVGVTVTSDWRTARAFLYSNGKMRYLDDLLPPGSGWKLTSAWDINDAGQIVGGGIYTGRDPVQGTVYGQSAFLLTPKTTSGSVALSSASISLTEGGSSGAYTVTLGSIPTANVTVTVSPDTQLSAAPAQLTFTPANWNTPQTVSVQALQDGIAEGNHTGLVSHATASTDPAYNALTVGKVTVSISEAVPPTVSIAVPPGTVWTQSSLPVTGTGTAVPGGMVMLTVTNTGTGAVTTFSALADGSGNWSLTLNGLADGSYELQPKASGLSGNKLTVTIDSQAPVSTLSVSSNNGPNAALWYNGPVNLSLSAADGAGGQGIARIEYALDGGATTVFPAAGLTLNSDGSHSFCYRAVDNAGNTEAWRCTPVAIDATAPQVNPLYDAPTGTLNLNAQDPLSGLASVEASLDGGATWSPQAGPISFPRDGSYTVQYRARDNAGNLASGQTGVIVATAPNITPPANQGASEGAAQTFTLGAFSDSAGDNPWSVDVDWGDGSAHSLFTVNAAGTLGTQAHTYADSGSYTVTVKVTDQAGNSANKSFQAVVANVAPSAILGSGAAVSEGGTAMLTFGSQTDPSNPDTQTGFRYAYACDGGSLATAAYANSSAAASTVCVFDDSGIKTVRARIIDKDDGFAEYTVNVTVNNAAPSASFSAGSPVNEGSAATLAFSNQTDPSSADALAGFHYAYACDGASLAGATYANSGAAASAACSYADNGSNTVRARIIDKDNGFTEYAGTVMVNNAAPTATLAVTGPIDEGGSAAVSFSNPADPSSSDTQAGFHYAFACDGSSLASATYAGSGTNPAIACAYPDGPAIHTVRARIIDKDGGFTEYTGGVTVNNVAPSVGTITAPAAPVNVNTAVNVSAPFSDAGMPDTHTATIAWGDGSVTAGTVTETNGAGTATGSHSYATAGQYVVTMTVTDKDGGAGSASYQSIVVIDVAGASVSSSGNSKIDSAAGAMPGNPGAAGNVDLQVKANYNLSGTLIGDTSFDFDAGNLHFQSTAYDWLIANGSKATIQGSGTINGAGSYGFVVTAIDGGKKGPDLLRMKIWDKADGQVMYDNQPGAADTADPVTPLSSGKITVK